MTTEPTRTRTPNPNPNPNPHPNPNPNPNPNLNREPKPHPHPNSDQVRKLLPDSWGFLCPVHTPDGGPCGLLNHVTTTCHMPAYHVPHAEVAQRLTLTLTK